MVKRKTPNTFQVVTGNNKPNEFEVANSDHKDVDNYMLYNHTFVFCF